jgi:spore germination protein GerM
MSPARSPRPPDAASPLSSRRRLWLTMGAFVGLLGIGVWLVFAKLPSFLQQQEAAGGTTPATAAKSGDARKIQATLFYVTEDGAELMPVGREVLYGASPSEQAKYIVEAQVAAPPGGMVSAIAANTKVRSVFLGSKGDAYVDLGAEAATSHTGGSLNEALAVFAIVNALSANLQGVTSVQILVDGKEVDTLAGHVDLRQPLARAAKWVRKAQ